MNKPTFDVTKLTVQEYKRALEANYSAPPETKQIGGALVKVSTSVHVDTSKVSTVALELHSMSPEERGKTITILENWWYKQAESKEKEYINAKEKCDFIFEDDKEYQGILESIDILTPCAALSILHDLITRRTSPSRRSAKATKLRLRKMAFEQQKSGMVCS